MALGGKAADRLDWSAAAWIIPELGNIELAKLTKRRIEAWHHKIAETPARLRTKPGAQQKHREADESPDSVRRRRSTANRLLTIVKPRSTIRTTTKIKANAPAMMHGARCERSAKPMRRGSGICRMTKL